MSGFTEARGSTADLRPCRQLYSTIKERFWCQVAKNEIWREAIRKEQKHIGGDSSFTINPTKRACLFLFYDECELLSTFLPYHCPLQSSLWPASPGSWLNSQMRTKLTLVRDTAT
jgi:hypothetical protein